MDQFQLKTKSSKDISSIADMQAFVESYPEFRKLSGDVTKHVTLLGEINRLVDQRCLMECSQVEQELACTEDHSSAVSEVENLLQKPTIALSNKLRLVLLYALRYEREPSNRIGKFVELLGAAGASPDQQRLVSLTLEHYGAAKRTGDLFGNKSMLTVMKKSLQRSVKGVQNVYTQHQPYIVQQLEQLTKGTLPEAAYPYLGAEPPAAQKKRAPTEVIVLMLGGATYEEARAVGEMNAANPGVRIVLLGTTMHNADSFLAEVAQLSGAAGSSSSGSSAAGGQSWTAGVDRKRIAALTSTMTSSVTSGVNSAMSKLQ
jgi:vacuolar protein sorting-associated protein 45